jgi:NAD(P)-dependent dehydrogenase (short-subunit alcohol dehydrogenase family)
MADPHDRIALVIGAGSGLGRALVPLLLAEGWRVVVSGRGLPALHDTLALCDDTQFDIHERALAVTADVTRPDSVAALFDVVRARYGRLDLLVQAAGLGSGRGVTGERTPLLQDEALDAWNAALATRLTGCLLCLQEAFRVMTVQEPAGGRIVVLDWAPGKGDGPVSLAAAAVRPALAGLVQQSVRAGRGVGIGVSLVEVVAGTAAHGAMAAAGKTSVHAGMAHGLQSLLHLTGLPPQAGVPHMTLL